MQQNGNAGRFAEREVRGIADDGASEVVTIWIERRPGAVWAVGRAVCLSERPDGTLHAEDYVFEGFEMGDALDAANEALRSDLEVSSMEGRPPQEVTEFSDQELLQPLERWFFGHAPR
jgi:hypothetical protein